MKLELERKTMLSLPGYWGQFNRPRRQIARKLDIRKNTAADIAESQRKTKPQEK